MLRPMRYMLGEANLALSVMLATCDLGVAVLRVVGKGDVSNARMYTRV